MRKAFKRLVQALFFRLWKDEIDSHNQKVHYASAAHYFGVDEHSYLHKRLDAAMLEKMTPW